MILLYFSKQKKKNLICFHFQHTVTVKLTKLSKPEIFTECYRVARNKPIRREITKLQTATVVNLWFWGLLAYPELYCDWPVHNQHSRNFSGVHVFLSSIHSISNFEYSGDQLNRSLDKNSFVNRHINSIVCWKWKQIRLLLTEKMLSNTFLASAKKISQTYNFACFTKKELEGHL